MNAKSLQCNLGIKFKRGAWLHFHNIAQAFRTLEPHMNPQEHSCKAFRILYSGEHQRGMMLITYERTLDPNVAPLWCVRHDRESSTFWMWGTTAKAQSPDLMMALQIAYRTAYGNDL